MTALVGCGALGVGAPSVMAQASTFEAGSFFPVSGPRLAGDDVAWAERGRRGGYTLVRRSLAGEAPRRLRTVRAPVANRFVNVGLAV